MPGYTDSIEPVYVKKLDGKWILFYSNENKVWQLKSKSFSESYSHIAYCEIKNTENGDKTIYDSNIDDNNHDQKENGREVTRIKSVNRKDVKNTDFGSVPLGLLTWKEYDSVNNIWISSGLHITALECVSESCLTSVGSLLHSVPSVSAVPLRRLIWCHTASTAILAVRTYNNSNVYVRASIPQATILLAFKIFDSFSLSIGQLTAITGLSLYEVQQLIKRLLGGVEKIAALTYLLNCTPIF